MWIVISLLVLHTKLHILQALLLCSCACLSSGLFWDSIWVIFCSLEWLSAWIFSMSSRIIKVTVKLMTIRDGRWLLSCDHVQAQGGDVVLADTQGLAAHIYLGPCVGRSSLLKPRCGEESSTQHLWPSEADFLNVTSITGSVCVKLCSFCVNKCRIIFLE